MDKGTCDILLMFPAADTNRGLGPAFTHTLGLGYVNAFLQSKGFLSSVFLSEKTSLPLCIKGILSLKPRVVGMSVVDDNYAKCLLIAKALKDADPSLILVLGGPTPSVNHEYILNNSPSIDICVRGEGEEVFCRLLQALSASDFHFSKADLTGVKGITYRKGHEAVINKPADILLGHKGTRNYLDSYPSPYLTGLMPATEAEHSGIVTARGCNQNCVYCNCAILYRRHVFTHSIDRVLQELSFVSRMSPTKAVNIFDDAFTLYPERAAKICRGIIENKIRLRLTCLTRCDYLSEDLLDLMKEAGFETVSFSLESAVPRLLRMIGKNHPPEDNPSDGMEKEARFIGHVKAMATYAKKIGMNVLISIILGLPTETCAEAAETLRYLNALPFDRYNHNFFRILEGTPIASNYMKYGYRLERVSKNQIRPGTIRPIDFSDMGRSRNSMQEESFRRNELDQFHVLGLLTKRKVRRCFFDNVIIRSDVISESLIRWLQGNLALGGRILQIFSGEGDFREGWKSSLRMLLDHLSPSTKLVCYYMEKNENGNAEVLTRGKNPFCEEMPIEISGTCNALGRYSGGNGANVHTLAMDMEKEDTESLLNLLGNFRDTNSCLDHLMGHKPYPLFAGLCRWVRRDANCRKLETAIIDENNNIKLCWGGDSVGTISDSGLEIAGNLKGLRAILEKERGCSRCAVRAHCMQCCFTSPLSVEQYCRFMKNHNVWKSAEVFKNYYAFADFFGILQSKEIESETL